MIKRQTVFVLGAGAHVPYDFPDGAGLIAKLLSGIPLRFNKPADLGNLSLGIYNNQADVTPQSMTEFRTALNMGGHTSIDSFLATHLSRPGFVTIGKLGVAYQLLPLEFRHEWARADINGDWITFLFQSMLHGCLESVDKFVEQNKVSFVTFNYDRTLEDFFCTRLSHTYNLTAEVAWQKAKRFSFVHVYGSLGEFDPKVINPQNRANRRAPLTPSQVVDAASSIRMMYEDRKEHSAVGQAMELITSAECVCFLGFGFDPDNIARLRLDQFCSHETKSGRVFATRYKTPLGDWNRIVNNMAPTKLNAASEHFDRNSINWDCLEFLHQTQALG